MSQDLTSVPSEPEFDGTKRVTAHGREYWSARDLMPLLGYATWSNFAEVIGRARASCDAGGQVVGHHFAETTKMVEVGSGAQREVEDWFISRYGAYLLAQCGDPRKPEIANAQAYFAVQTRRQELADSASALEGRIAARTRLAESNKRLAGAAKSAGVTSPMFGVFQDAGYKGLYAGMGRDAIKEHKGIPVKDDLLDRMGHVELAANDFRATQAEERLRRERIRDQRDAIDVHREVGEAVRKTILDQGNTPPEDLPPESNIGPAIAKLRRQAKKQIPPSEH